MNNMKIIHNRNNNNHYNKYKYNNNNINNNNHKMMINVQYVMILDKLYAVIHALKYFI